MQTPTADVSPAIAARTITHRNAGNEIMLMIFQRIYCRIETQFAKLIDTNYEAFSEICT